MTRILSGALGALAAVWAPHALAHGDVAPQPVDTAGLPEVGEEWLTENPYRAMDAAVVERALEVGSSGYNQNCARCHGLEVVSGGLAPDLRFLEAEEYGDEWFIERFRHGYTQNGVTKMPAFGELLGQEAAWAIRTYIEMRPDDEALTDHADRLNALRGMLAGLAEKVESGGAYAEVEPRVVQAKGELAEIAGRIGTFSGAPVADSPASRAADALDGRPEGLKRAAEILTIGLSQAQ